MNTQTEISQRNHRRAIRFFWGLLITATTVSIIGNISHALLPYISRTAIQIGAAAVPPVLVLAAVHGIALAVRAGASGTVYRWAVGAVGLIGVGAFAMSFLALRDLAQIIGYSSGTAWVFPAIIDTAVAVSTMMLVALGDKPIRRARTVPTSSDTQTPPMRRRATRAPQDARNEVTPLSATKAASATQAGRAQTSTSAQSDPAQSLHSSTQNETAMLDAETAPVDARLASELIAAATTTQSVETVISVLRASRTGASINAAAKASGINYRTAQRIVQGAEHRQLTAVS